MVSEATNEVMYPKEAAVTRLATEVVESPREPRRHRPAALSAQALTIYLYVLGAFFVTARLWINPTGRYQVGDPQDADQATWFVKYAETAVRHFRLPALETMAMNAPHGVNLMWNTAFLLPGIVVSPVTMLFGPQVALTTLLVIGFAGSAAAMFYVLRRWRASVLASALGGALYGFSPALINSGIGHYALVLAMLLPLIVDRVLRIATGQGSPVRNGLWLGLLVAAQLFISEESLVDAVIASLILLVVLAVSRPRLVLARIRPLAAGLATAGGVAFVLCARALWVQFHGVSAKSAAATVIINYQHVETNLGTLPYAFINPADTVLLHTHATGVITNNYPQPMPEYLAYLGVPMIILLLVAIVYFWRHLPIRVAGITCILLEWLGMGSKQVRPDVTTLPGYLLPWRLLEHLPVISGMVPDRLCILADAAAAAVLAFSLDLARQGRVPLFARWRHGAGIATALVVFALLPLVPAPYDIFPATPLPVGWRMTFAALHVKPAERVLLVPFPYSGTSPTMRWQADTGEPATMIGGDFIAPGVSAHNSRAGRSAMTATSYYINYLWDEANQPNWPQPTPAELHADLANWRPAVVVAVAAQRSPVGRYLISIFGPPTTRNGEVLGWRLRSP
jgi:hypothetical protein